MIKRPFFLAGFVYLLGTAVAFLSSEPHLWLIFGICSAVFFLIYQPKQRVLSLFLCAVYLLSFVAAADWQKQKEELLFFSDKTLRITALVTESRRLMSSTYYQVKADFGRKQVPLTLFSEDMELIPAGERVQAVISLQENDYDGITDIVLSGNIEQMESLGREESLQAHCLRFRTWIQQRIDKLFSGKSREVLSAVLLGEKAELSEETEEIFEKSGTIHLLTVSGFHISMISSGIFALFRIFRQNPRRAALLTLPFLVFLVLVEGMTISVLRAAIMAAMNYAALILQRDYDGLSAWGVAVILVLLPNPVMVFSKSFLLSFSAVLGILLFYKAVYIRIFTLIVLPKVNTAANKLFHRIGSILSFTISASLLMAPFQLYFFAFFSFTALISSPIALPLMPFIVSFAAAAIFMPWEMAARILAKAAQFFCALLYGSLRFFARLDWNLYGQSERLLGMILLFYAALFFLSLKKRKRQQKNVVLYASFCACVLLWNMVAFYTVPQVEITACRQALTMTYKDKAAVVGIMETENDRKEIDKILQTAQVETVDLLYLTGETRDDGMQALRFAEKWKPLLTASAVEQDAFLLTETPCQIGKQHIRFWDNWTLDLKEDSVILSDGVRKVLKLHEKYAIIKNKATSLSGEPWIWNQTWDGQWKITIKQEDRP